jgi:hypothetical protein
MTSSADGIPVPPDFRSDNSDVTDHSPSLPLSSLSSTSFDTAEVRVKVGGEEVPFHACYLYARIRPIKSDATPNGTGLPVVRADGLTSVTAMLRFREYIYCDHCMWGALETEADWGELCVLGQRHSLPHLLFIVSSQMEKQKVLNEKNVLRFLSVTEECPPDVLCPSALAIAAQNFESLLKDLRGVKKETFLLITSRYQEMCPKGDAAKGPPLARSLASLQLPPTSTFKRDMEQLLIGATGAEADLHIEVSASPTASPAASPPVVHLHSPVLRLNEVKSDVFGGAKLMLSKESALELFRFIYTGEFNLQTLNPSMADELLSEIDSILPHSSHLYRILQPVLSLSVAVSDPVRAVDIFMHLLTTSGVSSSLHLLPRIANVIVKHLSSSRVMAAVRKNVRSVEALQYLLERVPLCYHH